MSSGHALHVLGAGVLVMGLLGAVAVGEHVKARRPEPAVLVASLAGAAAAAIHLGVVPGHWRQAPLYGAFFLLAGAAQLGYSLLVLARPLRALVAIDVLGNLALLVLWAQTRTSGVPVGPAAGLRESVGPVDLTCALLELLVVAAGSVLLATRPGPVARAAARPVH